MTVSMTLGLEWGLDNLKLTLIELSDHDWNTTEGILEDIDFDFDVKFLLDSLVGSTSMRN
jgi:hypothetical protein